MLIIVVELLNPSERPASVCPGSTDIMPARRFSATYAPELMPKVNIAVISKGKLRIASIANAIMNSCRATGVPRIIPMYMLQIISGTFSFLLV